MSVVVIGGTVFYRAAEGWSWVDSPYSTVSTLTTVGYGDLSPTSADTEIFTIVLVLLGIGPLLSFIERVARYASEGHVEHRRPRGDHTAG